MIFLVFRRFDKTIIRFDVFSSLCVFCILQETIPIPNKTHQKLFISNSAEKGFCVRFEWNFMEKRHEIVSPLTSTLSAVCLLFLSVENIKMLSNIHVSGEMMSCQAIGTETQRVGKKKKVAEIVVGSKSLNGKLHNILHSTLHTFYPHPNIVIIIVDIILLLCGACWTLFSFYIHSSLHSYSLTIFPLCIFRSHCRKLFYAFHMDVLHGCWWVRRV